MGKLRGCKRGVSNRHFCPRSTAQCNHISIKLFCQRLNHAGTKPGLRQLGRPYFSPISATATSAIWRGFLSPVALTSITVRAISSQRASLRSATLSKFRA